MIELRKILCPVDFSEATDAGLRVALALGEVYDAELLLAHVLDFPHETVALERYYLEIEEEAIRRLDSLARLHESRGVPIETTVRRGTPYTEIVDLTEEWAADLLVMPTHGRAGLDRLMFGSVAERVLRLVPCSVLTVPPSEEVVEFAPRRVLFATDFSEHSDRALPVARSLSLRFDAELLMMHVVTPTESIAYAEGWEASLPPDIGEREEAAATADLESRIEEAAGEGAPPRIRKHLVRGTHAAAEIAELVDEEGADLVVVATHGHSGFMRAILGSTTEKLVRTSTRPVFVVRTFVD